MLDEDFCSDLEWKIGFHDSPDPRVRGFWCDGVLLPDNPAEYSLKTVNDKRQITLTAYIGRTGQDIYQLVLLFGPKALSRYARGLNILECIPDLENEDWWDVDIEQRILWLQLK